MNVARIAKPLADRSGAQETRSGTWRVITILEWVAHARCPAPVAQLITYLGLSKPVVRRVFALPECMALLQHLPGGNGAVVGARLFARVPGAMMSSERGTRETILRLLVKPTGEIDTLTILDDDQPAVLKCVESSAPVRVEFRASARVPLHCTTTGKLSFAMLSWIWRTRIFVDVPRRCAAERS